MSPGVPRYAALVGLAAVIPLPFLDELVRRVLMQRCFLGVAEAEGCTLTRRDAWRLARHRWSVVLGCLLGLVWWPVRKVFRYVLVILILQDFLDWMADAVVRSEMVRRACARGLLPGDRRRVWAAMDGAVDTHLRSPLWSFCLRRERSPVPWTTEPHLLDQLLRWLCEWSAAAEALAAFDAAMWTTESAARLPSAAAEE